MKNMMHIALSSKNYPGLDPSKFRIDSTGGLELKFKVTGINKYNTSSEGLVSVEGPEEEEEEIVINLECTVESCEVKKVSLQDAADRAYKTTGDDSKTGYVPSP